MGLLKAAGLKETVDAQRLVADAFGILVNKKNIEEINGLLGIDATTLAEIYYKDMGKIRVRSLGDEAQEQEQKHKNLFTHNTTSFN